MVEPLDVIPADLEDVFFDMARVHKDHRPSTRAGDVIRISVGRRYAYAVARGSKSNKRGSIALDLETRDRLGISPNNRYDFGIEKAGLWGQVRWAWSASDAMPRIAARLAVLSVALGGVGLILGLISLYK